MKVEIRDWFRHSLGIWLFNIMTDGNDDIKGYSISNNNNPK